MRRSHDRRLLELISAGDARALGELFDRHASLLALRLRRSGGSVAEAEDVVQETFVDVWRFAASYRGDGPVAAWLWGIATRKLAMAIRSEVRSRTRDANYAAIGAVAGDEADLAATVVDAENARSMLAPEVRAAFDAVVVEGLSVAEAAVRLGIPEGTVKSRVHRAKVSMREKMR